MGDVESAPLVQAATERLRTMGLIGDGAPQVSVRDNIDLIRSTVWLLDVSDADGHSTQIYFKRIKPRTESRKFDVVLDELRDTLTVAEPLEGRLAERLDPGEIQIGRTVVADPETLEQVTLAVPGRPLGRLWRRALLPANREQTREAMRLVGNACQVIEDVGRFDGPLPERLVGETVVERRIARVAGGLDRGAREKLTALMTELQAAAMDAPDPVYRAHGDLNASNVLIREGGVSLIDFAWLPRLRLTDLAHFAYRLEYESGSPSDFAVSLAGDLVDGYGQGDVTADPAWRFLRYSKLLRVMSDGGLRHPLGRLRASRARAEIEGALLG
ncbi:MAG TPA: phosphotransferase [Acidimicrobiia bacterium]